MYYLYIAMRLNLKRHTQEQIQDIFKTVSYHPTLTRTEPPDIETYPLADSLLKAYWQNDFPRQMRLAKLCETRAKKATNPATLVIHTGHMSTKEGVGGKLMDE
jgi:hypothetical protein